VHRALYEDGKRLDAREATQSVRVDITQQDQTVLDIPGALQPGRVHFQVVSPAAGRAGVRVRVETLRARSIGTQEFPVMSVSASGMVFPNFVSTLPITGGGWADFSGGVHVTATRLAAGIPATVVAWVEYSPGPPPTPGRCPDMLFASIPNGGTLEYGPPPAGARQVSIMADQTFAAGLALAWRDTGGATVAGWRQWDTGGPSVAPAGLSLIATNNTGAPADLAVAWT
jgi:hypothetical protein